MSRCFPFPPPGYVRDSASGDALIESIKIERQKERIKQERKEQKRREKEERKKEKKEKKREKEKLKSIQSVDSANKRKRDSDAMVNAEIARQKEKINQERKEQKLREKEERKKEKKEKKREEEKLKSIQSFDGGDKRKRDSDGIDQSLDKSWVSCKEGPLLKKNERDIDQLERSSLTEEYAQPILSESLSYSSDGTQSNSKKSKIEQSPSNVNCTTQGKVIRFRLKRREYENAQPTDDVPTTSGRTGTPITKRIDAVPMVDQALGVAPVPMTVTNDISSRFSKEFIPRPVEQLSIGATQAAKGSDTLQMCSLSVERTQKPKSPYEALFSQWQPPPIQFDAMDGNNDDLWLFTCKKQVAPDGGSLKAYDGVSGQLSSKFWPRAHLLPEVDLYALPFTVPF
uniref:Uncharacterized protein n=1 Tax=Kalanchoe fedtschenkoi TaxID=63787 RepID=A0A7N0UI44_KALFE